MAVAWQGRYREAAEAYARAGATRDAELMHALLEQRISEVAAMALSTAGDLGYVGPSLQPGSSPQAGQSARIATATDVRRMRLLMLVGTFRADTLSIGSLCSCRCRCFLLTCECLCLHRPGTSIECH